MKDNETQLKEIIKVLDKEGILKDVILIGSWCPLFYKYLFDNFTPMVRTTDVDFFVPNSKSFVEKDSVIKSLEHIKYEFLTRLNRKYLNCVELGHTGIFAESISNLDIFISNFIEVDYQGIQVKIASPASYVLQKLLIAQKRGEKIEKDIESVKVILGYIVMSKKYLDELNSLYLSLPKKWKKTIKENAKKNDIDLFD